jgi:hypothetical protein
MMMISRVPSPMYMSYVYPGFPDATQSGALQTGVDQCSATPPSGGSSGSPASSHASRPPAKL